MAGASEGMLRVLCIIVMYYVTVAGVSEGMLPVLCIIVMYYVCIMYIYVLCNCDWGK